MKILIAGAQGQVGSELVSVANQSKHTVFATTRSELDITQAKSVDAYISQNQPDIVINAAAYTAVDKAEEEHNLAYAINHDGVKNLAVVCSRNNIPLFHISTDYVFDGSKIDAYCEEDDVSPLGVYGESKWQGEESIREHMEQFIILRVAWVFGAHRNNFVKTMLRLGNEKDELNVVADQYGGPSPAKNIAETLIDIIGQYQKNKKLEWGTYHYCGYPKTTWHGFAKEIFHQAHEAGLLNKEPKVNPITTAQYPTPAKRPENSMLDCSKLNKTFGIEMPNWHNSLNEVLMDLK
ncbi:MAG: dTDP-4-dehydrorhamnose reductase [Gammaproteobacteria bacterium]|nr:dTDP-4-dehydrorhamnose reductase [Gammaproteobacteria bacterium]